MIPRGRGGNLLSIGELQTVSRRTLHGALRRAHNVHYKIPRYIEFVSEFPMTITGKIQKFVMCEQTIKKLGLKAEKTA